MLKGDTAAQDEYRRLYDDAYDSIMRETMQTYEYRKASNTKKAEMLEAARDDVAEEAKEGILAWLAKNRRSVPKKK